MNTKFWPGNVKGRDLKGIHRQDNINIDIEEMRSEKMGWILLAQNKGCCEHSQRWEISTVAK